MGYPSPKKGSPAVGLPRRIAAAASGPSICVPLVVTLDQFHAVIVNDSARTLQRHCHIAKAHLEACKKSDFSARYIETCAGRRAVFKLSGKNAARASMSLDV